MRVPRRLEDREWPGHLNDYALLGAVVLSAFAIALAIITVTAALHVTSPLVFAAAIPVALAVETVVLQRRIGRRRAYRRSRTWPLVLPPGYKTWEQTLEERLAVDPGMDARDLSRLTPDDIHEADRRLRREE